MHGSPNNCRPDPFYVESQGAFASRFATEMATRLGVACPLVLLEQQEFSEPMVRLNTDRIDGAAFGWSETSAWDAEAESTIERTDKYRRI